MLWKRGEKLWLRAELERIVGAGAAAGEQRAFADERGCEEERGSEEQRQDDSQGCKQVAVGGGSEPAGGEGEAEVQAHRDQRAGAEDTKAVEERYVRPLPGDRPGHVPERDEQRAEPAGRPSAPPHQPDEDRDRDQVGRVDARPVRTGEVLARRPEQEGRGGDRHQCERGGSLYAPRQPRARRAQPCPLNFGGTGRGEGLRARNHGLSLATGPGFRKRSCRTSGVVLVNNACPFRAGDRFR